MRSLCNSFPRPVCIPVIVSYLFFTCGNISTSPGANVSWGQRLLGPMSPGANVSWGQCLLGPMSPGANVSWGQRLLGPMSPGTNVSWGQCLLGPMSPLATSPGANRHRRGIPPALIEREGETRASEIGILTARTRTTSEPEPPQNQNHLRTRTTSEPEPPQNHLRARTTSEPEPPQNQNHLRTRTTSEPPQNHLRTTSEPETPQNHLRTRAKASGHSMSHVVLQPLHKPL
ncbi:hypothetical protein NHX12_024585 [Muraenolepis orangiensis]|uniref:Uncharacterized protein n=1 Tax=Muraenolepis orangiensis TaxID=630683 RepID=A0A9Q0EHT4_9TELE|nr:hypothetical protein NHX12_024585 [Muraenolepis orangiensis]